MLSVVQKHIIFEESCCLEVLTPHKEQTPLALVLAEWMAACFAGRFELYSCQHRIVRMFREDLLYLGRKCTVKYHVRIGDPDYVRLVMLDQESYSGVVPEGVASVAPGLYHRYLRGIVPLQADVRVIRRVIVNNNNVLNLLSVLYSAEQAFRQSVILIVQYDYSAIHGSHKNSPGP